MNDDVFSRPIFPKRAVITAGMPYGNKELHFGHVGGVFVHADIFARFLRDRIGQDNVIFVSGTDCYGVTIQTGYQNALADGFSGSISDYVEKNHENQKQTLQKYEISLNLFATSALGEPGEIHSALSSYIFKSLHQNNAIKAEETLQFYDEHEQIYLNGRQVTGRCPIQGCKSAVAYADECELGHQYNPSDLISPISTLSGKPPIQVKVKNWFFDLPSNSKELSQNLEKWEQNPACRKSLINVIREFLKNPSIYVKKELIETVKSLSNMPPFTINDEPQKSSSALIFSNLDQRQEALSILEKNSIRYRTGKAIVPFRLSGNVEWGIPVPETDGISGLTFWVWPESLWAPISFTKAFLHDGIEGKKWEQWWKSDDAQVFQFIGEDNIYFYGIAEMGIFSALDEGLRMPLIIPNHHLLYGKTKASSSGDMKPPKAAELLDYYTPEQLRLHFMNSSLSERSVGFEPKAFQDKTDGFDTVLYEGNLVTNVLNRLVRSCFYTLQKHSNGICPGGKVSTDVLERSNQTILTYERLMAQAGFDKIFELLNIYLRDANKDWSLRSKSEDKTEILQLLTDMLHIVRVCTALFHPIVPTGCNMIREYLCVDERIWSWDYIFNPLDFFIDNGHKFKFLEPRVDFFCKHPTQLKEKK